MKIEVEFKTFKQMSEKFKKMPVDSKVALLVIVEEIMKHLVERSRLNAPILTGDLRKGMKYSSPKLVGSAILTGIGVDGPAEPYALRWHEEEFNLGPRSAKQKGTPEGGVGNKYVSRAINYRKKKYLEIITEALVQSLVEDKPVKPKTKRVR